MSSLANAPMILVVDDSRVMRQALNKILGNRYPVVEAEDGEAAWALLESEPAVACVFTDLSMPRLDGYGLLKRIRESQIARVSGLPVVVVTGNEDDQGTLQRIRECGANELLKKPFRGEEVLRITDQLLKARLAAASSTAQAPGARDELNALREQLAQALAQTASALKDREQLEIDRDQLEKDLKQLRTELMLRQQTSDEREVQVRLKQLEQTLKTVRATESRLSSQLEKEQARNNELDARIHGLNRDLEQALTELNQTRERATSAERTCAELQARASDRDAANMDARIKAAELARLQAEDELLGVSGRLEEAEAALAKARDEANSARAEVNRLRAAARDREHQLEDQCQQLEKRLSQLLEQSAEASLRKEANEPEPPVVPEIPVMGGASPKPEEDAPRSERQHKGSESVVRWELERSRVRRRRLWLIGVTGVVLTIGLAFWLGTVLG